MSGGHLTAAGGRRPHAIYLAIGFPPAAKSSAYRLRETANQFAALGWDITVITISDEAWEREYGLDHTLSEKVDPRVKVVKLPLVRQDLETDIRAFSEDRSLDPGGWIKRLRQRQQKVFPEPVFGGWRYELENAVLREHRSHPADLLICTCAPYVGLAAAWKLWEEHRVPYAIDFRDGWSLDVIGGGEAFTRDSVAGRWESKLLEHAISVWCVNDAIAGFYRERYPQRADRVHVVRNGYDEDSLPDLAGRSPDPAAGLTFGYLGSVSFSIVILKSVIEGWRIARRDDPVLARSRFEVRGHFGAGPVRGANLYVELLKEAALDGVSFGGPVPKADVRAVYASWDAVVLILPGGRFMSSGKVYELMATGLPIVSAHEVDHDATKVLTGHPLWTGAVGLEPHRLADSFSAAAQLAVKATGADRVAAREVARRFTRPAMLAPAVRHLTGLVRPIAADLSAPAASASTGDVQP